MREIQLRLLVALAVLLTPLSSAAESPAAVPKEARATARRDAQATLDAFLKEDFERFASFMYPGLVKLIGGKEKVVAMLQGGLDAMKAEGSRFKSGSAGLPVQVVRAGQDLMTMVPVKQVMIVPEGELHISSHLLGVSSDNGRSWTFVDSGKVTPENVRSIIPNFNAELKLPPRQKPLLVPTKRVAR